jgi:phosphoglycolate phosphatase-like HAD superfamily hydrolase
MLFHAMEAAKIMSVAEVMAVGDTPLDLQAASNAGLQGMDAKIDGRQPKIQKHKSIAIQHDPFPEEFNAQGT